MPKQRHVHYVDRAGDTAVANLKDAKDYRPFDSFPPVKILGRSIKLIGILHTQAGRWIAVGYPCDTNPVSPEYFALSDREAAVHMVEWGLGEPVPADMLDIASATCPVELAGPGRRPILHIGGLQKHKPVLAPARYDVVKAPVDAYPDGLNMKLLGAISGRGGFRKIIRTLREDPDWGTLLLNATIECREGYRIATPG